MNMAVWGHHVTGAARLATAALRGPVCSTWGFFSTPPILTSGRFFCIFLLRLGAPLSISATSTSLLGEDDDDLPLPVCYCSLPINKTAPVTSLLGLRHFSTQQKEPGEWRDAFKGLLRSAGCSQGLPPVLRESTRRLLSSVPAGGPRRPPEEEGKGLASNDAIYQAAADSLLEGLGEQLQEASGIEEVDFRVSKPLGFIKGGFPNSSNPTGSIKR